MKRKLQAILGTTLILAMVSVICPNKAFADAAPDNNDTKETAQAITSKQPVTGTITTQEDVDYYEYTVDTKGHFEFVFKSSSTDSPDWYVNLYDSDMNELESHIYGSGSNVSQTYDFKKGTKLYIKVFYPGYGSQTLNTEYSLQVNATQDSNWEQEKNDTKANATKLSSNKKMHGNFYCSKDVDLYQYKVDVSGYVDPVFTNESTKDCTWKVSIYDSSMNELQSRLCDQTTNKFDRLTLRKGTILYVKLEYLSYGNTIGTEYSIQMNAKNDSRWEQENNDAYSKSNSLKKGAQKMGTIGSTYDKDYYKYTATKTGTVKLAFKYGDGEPKDGWKILIYSSSKKLIKTSDALTSNKTISFKAKKGQSYYVVVTGAASYFCPTGVFYSIKLK